MAGEAVRLPITEGALRGHPGAGLPALLEGRSRLRPNSGAGFVSDPPGPGILLMTGVRGGAGELPLCPTRPHLNTNFDVMNGF